MGWTRFDLDHHAQRIVLAARKRDPKSLNQAYKLRATCAYGLERFWGEHLRLNGAKANQEDQHKAAFVADVWKTLSVELLPKAGIKIPTELLSNRDSERQIEDVAERLWDLNAYDRQVALAVLTNLSDAVVWWTQRLKGGADA
jgi:hypothetical protein